MAKRDGRKGKRWSYTAGHYPFCVRVYERKRGGLLYIAAHDPTLRNGHGGERRKSLEHCDKEAAIEYADEQARKLRKGDDRLMVPTPTVGRVLQLYEDHRTPEKGVRQQLEDARQIDLWTAVIGEGFDLSRFSRREWDRFIRERRSGSIDGRGVPVPEDDRRKVGDRVIQKDLGFLGAVCRWASEWRDDSGRLLLEKDPTRGYDAPAEKNPQRPVASHDRVDAIRKEYRKPIMRVEWHGQEEVESYLPEIFEIVVGTGRRISAVCGLRYEDLELQAGPDAPWGAIVWPEDLDKMGKRWRCPVSADVRKALEAAIRKRQR
ncbi:MAG: hypothetical protein ACRD3V_16450, partial [Vicinamibacteria bacterium]